MNTNDSKEKAPDPQNSGLQLEWLDKVISNSRYWIWFFLILAIACLTLPLLLTRATWFEGFDSSSGNVGDSIGGILTPTIAFFGIMLTFVAFYIQYKANQQQYKAAEQQRMHTKQEWFEKVLFTQLESHEKLKQQLNRSGRLEKELDHFQKVVFNYSRQYRKRSFSESMNVNPDREFKLDAVFANEYMDSIMSLIEVVENEGLVGFSDWEERKPYYVKNFIYRKLDLNEKYLLGYMLERRVYPALSEVLQKYEHIFTAYYKKTGHFLKRDDILAPRYFLSFATTVMDDPYEGTITVSMTGITMPELFLSVETGSIELLAGQVAISELDDNGNLITPYLFNQELFKGPYEEEISMHVAIKQDVVANFIKNYLAQNDISTVRSLRRGFKWFYTFYTCFPGNSTVYKGTFEGETIFKRAVSDVQQGIHYNIKLKLKLNPFKMNQ